MSCGDSLLQLCRSTLTCLKLVYPFRAFFAALLLSCPCSAAQPTTEPLASLCANCSAGKTDAAAGIGLGLGSFWNVATAVTSAVKQSANEVVKSVQHTDWKSELAAFTQEVEAEAHKAVEVVQHLPQHIAHPLEQQQQQGTRLSRISEVWCPQQQLVNLGITTLAGNKQQEQQQLRCSSSYACAVRTKPCSSLNHAHTCS